MKNSLQGHNCRSEQAKRQISELEIDGWKLCNLKKQSQKMKKNEQSPIEIWDNFMYPNIHIMTVPKDKEREKGI